MPKCCVLGVWDLFSLLEGLVDRYYQFFTFLVGPCIIFSLCLKKLKLEFRKLSSKYFFFNNPSRVILPGVAAPALGLTTPEGEQSQAELCEYKPIRSI